MNRPAFTGIRQGNMFDANRETIVVRKLDYIGCDFSENDTVWKYYTLLDFLCMVLYKKLYFKRADYFSDPNEYPLTRQDADFFGMNPTDYYSEINRIKSKSFINCWRISRYESFGMWKAYSDINSGVAIRTTAGDLMNSINSCVSKDSDVDIDIGKVYYIDEEKDLTQRDMFRKNVLYIPFTKTMPYHYENELRLFIEEDSVLQDKVSISIDINPHLLIKEIVIAPMAKSYHFKTISEVFSKLDLNVDIKQSIVR